jgi:hypothetical protein
MEGGYLILPTADVRPEFCRILLLETLAKKIPINLQAVNPPSVIHMPVIHRRIA